MAMDGIGTPRLEVLWLEDDDDFFDNAAALLRKGAAAIPPGVGLRFRPSIRRAVTLHDALADLSHNPDLVVVDLNLPDSRGVDTVMTLRRAVPGTPMLILTVVEDIEPAMLVAVEGAEFLDKDDLSPARLVRAAYMAIMRASAPPLP